MRRWMLMLALGVTLAATIRPALAASRTFPETNQTVAGRMLDYWNQNGGLPVFGLPISDQRQETTRDGAATVQHFERNRFELHPELAAPYDVLLGRLGDDVLQRQNRNWRDEPNQGNPLGGACRRFNETNRDVCGPFLAYWQSRGLRDSRLNAYQRSLALFGLPLTGVKMERNSSGDEVLTQWFERARFEYHPSNPNPYKVLLGRLGAEAYDPQSPNGEPTRYKTVTIPEIGRALTIPVGFNIELLTINLNRPRMMAQDTYGNVYLAEMGSGRVLVFLVGPHNQIAWGSPEVLADGLLNPHSIAISGTTIFIATEDQVLRGSLDEYRTGQKLPLTKIIDLPTGSRDLYGHRTRTLAIGSDGKLYVSIGSSCDLCEEIDPRRATVMRFNGDGSGGEIFAKGLRNSVGIAFRPGSTELWGVDNGRNNLGDAQPPEELNKIVQGGDYGWPYCQGDRVPSPEFNNPARCAATIPPAWTMDPHTAPLGLAFYNGLNFPASYQGDAIVARHGTAGDQVTRLNGYDLLRIRFKDGQPVAQETLVSGWLQDNTWWGRPVGVLVARDGSLIISDDGGGRLYRLSYTGQ